MRHIIRIGIIVSAAIIGCASPVCAQLDDDEKSYQAFKIKKGQTGPAGGEMVTISPLPLGNGVIFFRNGRDNTPLTGTYRLVISNTKYAIADFVKGLAHGDWEDYHYNSLYWKGSFARGYSADGKSFTYENDYTAERTRQGGVLRHYIAHYKNGQVREEIFYNENGNREGNVKTYDKSGVVTAESNYVDGIRTGIQRTVLRDGYVEEVEYNEKGRKEGHYAKFYPNGNVVEQGVMDREEKKTGRWIFGYENGNPKEEAEYLSGRLHGLKRTWFEENLPESEENYKNNFLDGRVVYWQREPHQITSEGSYLAGDRHGVFKVYHDGILWREAIWFENREVGNKIYDNGKLQLVQLLDETGSLTDVAKYDNTGKRTYRNSGYKKHTSIEISEDASGVIDVKF